MSKVPSKNNDKGLTVKYADSKWLRTAVAAIPYIGGSLDIIFSHRAQADSRRRIEFLLNSLSEEMSMVEADKIDKKFLNSEEWSDIVLLAVSKSARIRNLERIRAIVKILVKALVGEIETIPHTEDLIDVIGELRDEEAIVLAEIYKDYIHGKGVFDDYGRTLKGNLPVEMHDRLPFLLKRIESIGLIKELTGTFVNYAGGSYRLTSTGKELLEFLFESGENIKI